MNVGLCQRVPQLHGQRFLRQQGALGIAQQALADGAFGLALGLPLHLGEPPFITGSALVTKVLTEDMKALTGGQVVIDPDAVSAADKLEKIIMEKRAALKI